MDRNEAERDAVCRAAASRCRLSPEQVAEACAALAAVWRDAILSGGRAVVDGIGVIVPVRRDGGLAWDANAGRMRMMTTRMDVKLRSFSSFRRRINADPCGESPHA